MHEDILLSTERIDQLYSSKIKIIQSSEVFSFSIDAILLAVRDLKSANEKKDSDQFTIARDKFTVAINAWIGLQNELTQESQLRIDNLLREF